MKRLKNLDFYKVKKLMFIRENKKECFINNIQYEIKFSSKPIDLAAISMNQMSDK